MWSELFKFVLSQVITGIGVYFTYKSYKQANQKNQHSENDSKSISFMEPKNNSNPAEVISKQRKRIQKQIKTQQVLNLIPALIVLLYCAFVGYSLYNNLPIIQHFSFNLFR